jgi:hypothetical protein
MDTDDRKGGVRAKFKINTIQKELKEHGPISSTNLGRVTVIAEGKVIPVLN